MAKFNGFFESQLFRIIIGPLLVASIAGLVILYGSVKAIETRMSVATIRRDEQFTEIKKALYEIQCDIKVHNQNYSAHVPLDELRKIFKEK